MHGIYDRDGSAETAELHESEIRSAGAKNQRGGKELEANAARRGTIMPNMPNGEIVFPSETSS